MITRDTLELAIVFAGIGQLVLVVGSAAIPYCLNWKGPLSGLPKLLRQLFLTYAGYLLGMHLFFGVISTFGSSLLLDGTAQAAILCGLMTVWWGVRIVLQFFCFDRKGIPHTRFNVVAEVLLVLLFVYLTITYAAALYLNLNL